MVNNGWVDSGSPDGNWNVFSRKAKNCKCALSSWHSKTFKNAAVEISKLKNKLQIVLNDAYSSSHLDEVKRIRSEID